MSLFGDFDDDANAGPFTPRSARKTNPNASSLFDNDRTDSPKPSSGLFSDDLNTSSRGAAPEEDSPWSMPTPKNRGGGKRTRRDLIRGLLAGVTVPTEYERAFEALVERGFVVSGSRDDGDGERINSEGLNFSLDEANIKGDGRGRVLEAFGDIVGEGLGKREVYVAIALMGLAAEGEEVGLDAVDERRRNLPTPSLPFLQRQSQEYATPAQTSQKPLSSHNQVVTSSPSKLRTPAQRKQSFGLDQDPWASPELHRGHNHEHAGPRPNGLSTETANNDGVPQRTTSSFTTTSVPVASNSAAERAPEGGDAAGSVGASGGWADYNPSGTEGGFSTVGGFGGEPENTTSGAAGANADDHGDLAGLGRPISTLRPQGPEEVVTVSSIPEKEGMMFFQHRNYEVASARRNSRVVRRYSDFVWLLDCLHKRYPFRTLPLLPPKRVAINGNHIAADASFIEKRRRGLSRFTNALVRHPVLGQEQLVIMFLTVPTELSVWRKQATISVQDEFLNKPLPPNLEDSLPSDLQALFERVRSGVRRSAELYINLCTMVERLAKRQEGLAAEYNRIAGGLGALTECSEEVYAADTNGVPLLNAGLSGTARHYSTAKSLLDDEVRAVDEGVLEDLKLQRDGLVSIRDLFERRDRLDKDDIPKLERRIQNNEAKLRTLRARPEGQGKPGDIEKVEEAIFKDQSSIVAAHARHVFIKQALREEITYFQSTQFSVARYSQDWAAERVKYAELQAENWRGAVEEVEGMVV